MELQLSNKTVLFLEKKEWIISSNRNCKILNEDEEFNYELENDSGNRVKLSKLTIEANKIEVRNNIVELNETLYNHYFYKTLREKSSLKFNELFKNNVTRIFSNKDIVFSKAEYYLLQPNMLTSGSAYIGGFKYNIGSLLELWIEKPDTFYFHDFAGYKDMYLISVSGSVLSGVHISVFWCESEKSIVNLPSRKGQSLPGGFGNYLFKLKEFILTKNQLHIDFQNIALENMLNEIDLLENKIKK
jgi:hypothetical protein